MTPSPTAVAQPIADMGNLAAKPPINRTGGYDGPPEHRTPARTFQHRDSCGCPAPGSAS